MPPRAEENNTAALGNWLALELPDQHGKLQRLADYHGTNVVLYFYPRDDTPGCTVEGKEFRELHEQFIGLDCVVIGVSTDSAESHFRFAEKHGLPFSCWPIRLAHWRAHSACSKAGWRSAPHLCWTVTGGWPAPFSR